MSWPALIASIVLTVLLASPFQWFRGAGKDTFIRREPSPGAAWGEASFLSGIAAIAWVGLFGGPACRAPARARASGGHDRTASDKGDTRQEFQGGHIR